MNRNRCSIEKVMKNKRFHKIKEHHPDSHHQYKVNLFLLVCQYLGISFADLKRHRTQKTEKQPHGLDGEKLTKANKLNLPNYDMQTLKFFWKNKFQ